MHEHAVGAGAAAGAGARRPAHARCSRRRARRPSAAVDRGRRRAAAWCAVSAARLRRRGARAVAASPSLLAAARPRLGRRPPRRRRPFTDVTPPAGIRFRHDSAAPSARSTCPRRWARAGAFSTTTTTAGRTSFFVELARRWPGQPGGPTLLGALPQQPQRHVHRRDAAGGPRRRRCTGWASPRPTTTTTAASTSTSPRSAANRLFRNEGNGTFADVTAKSGVEGAGLLDQRDVLRLRPRREARPVRRQLRARGRSTRTCSARSTARRSPTARPSRTRARARTLYRNRGDGTFEDATQQGGPVRPDARRRSAWR